MARGPRKSGATKAFLRALEKSREEQRRNPKPKPIPPRSKPCDLCAKNYICPTEMYELEIRLSIQVLVCIECAEKIKNGKPKRFE